MGIKKRLLDFTTRHQNNKVTTPFTLRHIKPNKKTMKQFIISIVLLISNLYSSSAFTCSPRAAFTTTLQMADEAAATTEKKEMFMDENFDDVDIVRLLGIRRVKKMIRRDARLVAVEKAEEAAKNIVVKPKGRWRKRNKN